ncbi:MAG: hypothetical protein DIKNOCCD_02730 [bacterium]|nr:hypothetical protein [bacterium]
MEHLGVLAIGQADRDIHLAWHRRSPLYQPCGAHCHARRNRHRRKGDGVTVGINGHNGVQEQLTNQGKAGWRGRDIGRDLLLGRSPGGSECGCGCSRWCGCDDVLSVPEFTEEEKVLCVDLTVTVQIHAPGIGIRCRCDNLADSRESCEDEDNDQCGKLEHAIHGEPPPEKTE